MPRSLRFCYDWLETSVAGLCEAYGERPATADLVAATRDRLCRGRMDDIFKEGLHEYLSRFIGEAAVLAHAIHDTYLSGEMR